MEQQMTTEQNAGNVLDDPDLNVPKAAREKIAELIQSADTEINSVRIFVSGGGCNGMDYGMTFADSSEARDSVLEGEAGFRVVIDPLALAYMQGAEIDYSEDGPNASFVFNNVFKAVGGSGSCGGCGGAGF